MNIVNKIIKNSLLIFLLILNSYVYADINIKKLTVLSTKGQKFLAKIMLPKEQLSGDFAVAVTNSNGYNALGIVRNPLINNIKISVIKSSQQHYIQLATSVVLPLTAFTLLLDVTGNKVTKTYMAHINLASSPHTVNLLLHDQNLNNLAVKLNSVADIAKYQYANRLQPPYKYASQEQQSMVVSEEVTRATLPTVQVASNSLTIADNQLKISDTKVRLQRINDAIPNSAILDNHYDNNWFNMIEQISYFGKDLWHNKLISYQKNINDNFTMWGSGLAIILLFALIYLIMRRRRSALQNVYLGSFAKIQADRISHKNYQRLHKKIKRLLAAGDFDTAMRLFRAEFRARGISLYYLCKYYQTFQRYGITEFATDIFQEELLQVPANNNFMDTKAIDYQQDNDIFSAEVAVAAERSDFTAEVTVTEQQHIDDMLSDEVEDISLDFLPDNDVLTAQLNLATAYLNMGHHEQAINILTMVKEQGNPQQRKEADKLLKKISH